MVPNPPYSYPTTFSTGPYAGFSAQVTDYLITSEVRGDNSTRSRLTQIIRYVQVPLFQFGVFYGAGVDLEIAPGVNMTFNGRVHSNSNLYVGAGAALSFDSTITTAGGIFRRIKRDSSIPWGNDPQSRTRAARTARSTSITTTGRASAARGRPPPGRRRPRAPSATRCATRPWAWGRSSPHSGSLLQPAEPDVIAHQLIEIADPSDAADLRAAKMFSKSGLRIVDGAATDMNNNAVSLPGGIVTTRPSTTCAKGGR